MISEDLPKDFKDEVEVIRVATSFPEARVQLEKWGLKPLRELFNYYYHTQGLTIQSIAGMLHKSADSTHRAMKKETIPLRPPHKPLDFWELGEKEKRLPPTYIAGIGTYARRNIWVPSLDDIYLLGLLFSDGWAYLDIDENGRIGYLVAFSNGCYELIKKAEGLMARFGKPLIEYFYCWAENKVLYRKYLKPEEKEWANFWRVILYNKRLFNAMKINPRETNYETISYCLKTKERTAAFIRGFADGEMSPSPEKRVIDFFQADYKLAYVISEALDRHFGIPTANKEMERDNIAKHPYGVYTFRSKGIMVSFYGKDNFKRYHAEIGFQHPNKRKRLEEMIK